jgi:hypothetical protein
MFKRRRQQRVIAELGELEARIARCQQQLADVMAAHGATADIVMRLETQIEESRTRASTAAAARETRASGAPAKAGKKKWSWRGRRAA